MTEKEVEVSRDLKLPPVVFRLETGQKTPVCVIVVGMAGSGKTSLLTQMQRSLQQTTTTAKGEEAEAEEEEDDCPYYCINLDPATVHMPYEVTIDIRDTVNYQQVMQQHQLGPNGAIMTSLNLFATKFDQVLGLLEKRAFGNEADVTEKKGDANSSGDHSTASSSSSPTGVSPLDYILVDTPGQIEAFTWSASGSIMSEALASSFPTVLCFVVDTVRCASSPNTFMSNMLYACSMMYRTRLPLVVCFNKIDVVSHHFCLEWMRDYEAFQTALDETAEASGFYGSLTRSLSLMLDEFYSNFANACGVSAVTGDGMDEFWETVQKARQDFCDDYIDDLKNRMEEQQARQRAMARSSLLRLQRDLDEAQEQNE